MIQDVVTGIRSRESLAEEGLDEDLEASISECSLVILNIKGKIGAAKLLVALFRNPMRFSVISCTSSSNDCE